MDWDMQKIQNWNKYRFPKNTIVKQRRKVEEEIAEYYDADGDNRLEELADVYIAFAGFSRFSKLGEFVCCKLFEQRNDFDKLKKAIANKMQINITREFDKNMHHIGDYHGEA